MWSSTIGGGGQGGGESLKIRTEFPKLFTNRKSKTVGDLLCIVPHISGKQLRVCIRWLKTKFAVAQSTWQSRAPKASCVIIWWRYHHAIRQHMQNILLCYFLWNKNDVLKTSPALEIISPILSTPLGIFFIIIFFHYRKEQLAVCKEGVEKEIFLQWITSLSIYWLLSFLQTQSVAERKRSNSYIFVSAKK